MKQRPNKIPPHPPAPPATPQVSPPSPIDPAEVADLAFYHCSLEEIAAELKCTLADLQPYQLEIQRGRLRCQVALKRSFMDIALGGDHPGMLRFLAKQYLNFTEDPVLAEQRRLQIEIKRDELVRNQAEARLPAGKASEQEQCQSNEQQPPPAELSGHNPAYKSPAPEASHEKPQ